MRNDDLATKARLGPLCLMADFRAQISKQDAMQTQRIMNSLDPSQIDTSSSGIN